jgi:hypothetical protein
VKDPNVTEQDPAHDAMLEALRHLGSIDLEPVPAEQARAGRVRLVDVRVQEQESASSVVVTLAHGSRTVDGVARGGGGEFGSCRTAATAALDALVQLLVPHSAQLHLDWVSVLSPPSPQRPPVVHVTVALRTAAGEQLLAGSALVRDHLVDAAVRAALDSVNRCTTPLLGDA